MAIDISKDLAVLKSAANGQIARKPIANILERFSTGGGDVSGMVNGEGKIFKFTDFHTPATGYNIFKNGNYYVNSLTENYYDGKKALTNAGMCDHLSYLDKTLGKILGTSSSDT